MEEFLRPLNTFRSLNAESVRAAIDILLVSFLVYRLLMLVRGTRAWRIVGGVLVFVLFLTASSMLKLDAFHWIMDKATLLAPVALVILLLPELRQALEQFGQIGFWPRVANPEDAFVEATTLEETVAACAELAASRTGALIIFERSNSLDEVIANGVQIGAKATAPLLGSIFFGQNPLHDGAVIIRGDKIMAAACRLPMSERMGFDPFMHMRHKAGVGMTEQSDAVAVVVSEERGTISVGIDGNLKRVEAHELRDFLNRELRGIETDPGPKTRRIGRMRHKEKEDEASVATP